MILHDFGLILMYFFGFARFNKFVSDDFPQFKLDICHGPVCEVEPIMFDDSCTSHTGFMRVSRLCCYAMLLPAAKEPMAPPAGEPSTYHWGNPGTWKIHRALREHIV